MNVFAVRRSPGQRPPMPLPVLLVDRRQLCRRPASRLVVQPLQVFLQLASLKPLLEWDCRVLVKMPNPVRSWVTLVGGSMPVEITMSGREKLSKPKAQER